MLTMVGSRTSKFPFEQLFYDADKKISILLNKEKCQVISPYLKDFLESVRLGPSVLNEQSWKFVLTGKEVHVFDIKFNSYSQFDIGISLANLDLLKEIRGGSCSFEE